MTGSARRLPRRPRPAEVKVRGDFAVTGWVSDRPDLELRVTEGAGRELVDRLCKALDYWPTRPGPAVVNVHMASPRERVVYVPVVDPRGGGGMRA